MKKIKNRKGKGIRVWMIQKNLIIEDVRKDTKTKVGSIPNFIEGRYTSKRLQEYFIHNGCPAKFFKNGRVVV